MFNTTTYYTLEPTDYIYKAFSQLPSNAFINKGKCGIGATNLEIKNKSRPSIIVASTVAILLDKQTTHPDLLIIHGGVTVDEIKLQLIKRRPAQKIMVTPDSFIKLVNAAIQVGMFEEMKQSWFLLLDEAHTFITEAFRKNILRPFNYFWGFENKSIITATPYYFSDPRCKELDYHEIQFTTKLQTITLVECLSVEATLEFVLNQRSQSKGNFHVMYNSVTCIANMVSRLGLTKEECAIFCADDKDGDNMEKLGDLKSYYVEQPNASNFRKINFYTCRYFEGWDLLDKDATIILVTNVHQPHTKISIGMKLKQAAGRIREEVKDGIAVSNCAKLIHLTNHHRIEGIRMPLDHLQAEYSDQAELLLKHHSEHHQLCKAQGRKLKLNPELHRFADIDDITYEAKFNSYLFDQVVNEAYSYESFNHINHIKAEWEAANFNVILKRSYAQLQTKTTMKRKSKATRLKEDYQQLIALQDAKDNKELVYMFGDITDSIKQRNPLAYQAYLYLDQYAMEELKCNEKKVKQAVIIASNLSNEAKLLKLLFATFEVGKRYSIEYINNTLNKFYTELGIMDSKGDVLKAEAIHLKQDGRFDIHPCKMEGTNKNGYVIVRSQFCLTISA